MSVCSYISRGSIRRCARLHEEAGLAVHSQAWSRCEQLGRREGTPAPRPWVKNGHRLLDTSGSKSVESRCDAVALGSNISVAAPFVRRCLTGSTMAPFSHPAHRTGQADFPHPALGQDVTLSRATPSAASEHLLELIGFPISRSFTTYCVCLELRSLPSTGVTRLPRYYEPLRHTRAPSLSLTGFRLVLADHAMGLPVFRALSLCTRRRHYPGAAPERITSLISSRRISLPR